MAHFDADRDATRLSSTTTSSKSFGAPGHAGVSAMVKM